MASIFKITCLGIILGLAAISAPSVRAEGRDGAASAVRVPSAGTLKIANVPSDDWPAVAQKEIHAIGPVVGISGGVKRWIVENQRSGQDCWAFTLNGLIEAYYWQHGAQINLSPNYSQFWHIYAQLERHLPEFQELSKELKERPNDPVLKARIQKVMKSFRKDVRRHASGRRADKGGTSDETEDGEGVFIPDVGNDAPTAIEELLRFGFSDFHGFPSIIKSDEQEDQLEAEIARIVGDMIRSDASGRVALSEYKECDGGSINESLYQLMKKRLDPIYKASILRPTDTWVYNDRTYSPLEMLQNLKSKGLDPGRDWRSLIATPATHEQALIAIADALTSKNLPVPIGIALANDKVNKAGDTAKDFAESSGLFTSSVCPGGPCKTEDGSHEIKVVNYLAASTDGKPVSSNLTKEEKLALVKQGRLKITALVIQNSWGPFGGVDANGNKPSNRHHGGYYVITTDYLLNTGLDPINDMYDFVLPSDVADRYPSLVVETPDGV